MDGTSTIIVLAIVATIAAILIWKALSSTGRPRKVLYFHADSRIPHEWVRDALESWDLPYEIHWTPDPRDPLPTMKILIGRTDDKHLAEQLGPVITLNEKDWKKVNVWGTNCRKEWTSTIAHEAGHCFGLDHDKDGGVMDVRESTAMPDRKEKKEAAKNVAAGKHERVFRMVRL